MTVNSKEYSVHLELQWKCNSSNFPGKNLARTSEYRVSLLSVLLEHYSQQLLPKACESPPKRGGTSLSPDSTQGDSQCRCTRWRITPHLPRAPPALGFHCHGLLSSVACASWEQLMNEICQFMALEWQKWEARTGLPQQGFVFFPLLSSFSVTLLCFIQHPIPGSWKQY